METFPHSLLTCSSGAETWGSGGPERLTDRHHRRFAGHWPSFGGGGRTTRARGWLRRSDALLTELAQKIRAAGGVIETVHADITSTRIARRWQERRWRISAASMCWLTTPASAPHGHFAEVSPERLRKIMEVNFFALVETTRQFLPLLRLGTTPAILNISSIAGKRGIPARSEYSASKFAVQGFSEALRTELVKDGIDVLLVCPD